VAESFGAADGLLRPAVGEHGWPGPERWLLVGRSVSEPTEHGYHLGNAPSETPLESLARVAVARWPIERRRGLGGAQPRGGLALDAPLVPLSTPEARCLLEPSSRPWRYGWRGPPRAERIRPSVGAAITAVVTLVQPYLAERASEPRAPARLPSVCWPGHYGAWFGSGGSGRCPSPNNPRLVSPP
jgi:hypothetical protein